MEIGGYIELYQNKSTLYHNEAVPLNSARNCLAYLIEAKSICNIRLPKFLCSSVEQICQRYNIKITYYTGKGDLTQHFGEKLSEDEWLYLVNYYGQLSNGKIAEIKKQHDKLIVDNVQAYFQMPVKKVDTIYTCRKYFGVPDGAFLYTDSKIGRKLEQDKSADRMEHLLGRYEGRASKYYPFYLKNEENFYQLPLRKMSKLTDNLLRGINYEENRLIREENFSYLHGRFEGMNCLRLIIPTGPFVYPLYIKNGDKIREILRAKGIYVPIFWPEVIQKCKENDLEYDLAKNILPLPIDPRYSVKEMKFLADQIMEAIDIAISKCEGENV